MAQEKSRRDNQNKKSMGFAYRAFVKSRRLAAKVQCNEKWDDSRQNHRNNSPFSSSQRTWVKNREQFQVQTWKSRYKQQKNQTDA